MTIPVATATDTSTDIVISTDHDALSGWHVLLWNDDVHSMDYVVAVLVRCIQLDVPGATRVMLEAHTSGKAIAWSGAKELAEMYRDRLEGYGLTATIAS